MDWAGAIERNSEALKGIVAALFAMLEQAGGAAAARIPRPVHRALLSVLRPAESALRRLIVIAAQGVVVKPAPSRPMPRALIGKKSGRKGFSFQLFDPRKRFAPRRPKRGPRLVPRIRVLTLARDRPLPCQWIAPPVAAPAPAAPPDDGCIDASRLRLRLDALKRALDDLPAQARRLVRLRSRRAKVPSLQLKSPLRPGRPPGYRKRQIRDIDRVLAECHGLALDVLAPNTS